MRQRLPWQSLVRFDVSMTLNQPLVSELSVLRGMPSFVPSAATPPGEAARAKCRESFNVLRGELNTPALAKPDFLNIHGIR